MCGGGARVGLLEFGQPVDSRLSVPPNRGHYELSGNRGPCELDLGSVVATGLWTHDIITKLRPDVDQDTVRQWGRGTRETDFGKFGKRGDNSNRTKRAWSMDDPAWSPACPPTFTGQQNQCPTAAGPPTITGSNLPIPQNGLSDYPAKFTYRRFAPYPGRPDTSFASLVRVNGSLKVMDVLTADSAPLFPALRTVGTDALFIDFVDTAADEPLVTLPALETVGGRLRLETTKCYFPPGHPLPADARSFMYNPCVTRISSPDFPALTSLGSLWIGPAARAPTFWQNGNSQSQPFVGRVSFPSLVHVEFQMILQFTQGCGYGWMAGPYPVAQHGNHETQVWQCSKNEWLSENGCPFPYGCSFGTLPVLEKVDKLKAGSSVRGRCPLNDRHITDGGVWGSGGAKGRFSQRCAHVDPSKGYIGWHDFREKGVSLANYTLEFPALQTLGGRGTWPKSTSPQGPSQVTVTNQVTPSGQTERHAVYAPLDYGCDSAYFDCADENETRYRDFGSELYLDLASTRAISFPALRWTDHSIYFASTSSLETISFPALTHMGGGMVITLSHGNSQLNAVDFSRLLSIGVFWANLAQNTGTTAWTTLGEHSGICPWGLGVKKYSGLGVGPYRTTGELKAFNFPSLQTVGGDVQFEDTQSDTFVDFPSLEHIGGRAIIRAKSVWLPALESTLSNAYSSIVGIWVHLPRYRHASGDLEVRTGNKLALPRLSRVEGSLSLHVGQTVDSLKLPDLVFVGKNLVVGPSNGLDSLSFPRLQNVSGTVDIKPKVHMDLDPWYTQHTQWRKPSGCVFGSQNSDDDWNVLTHPSAKQATIPQTSPTPNPVQPGICCLNLSSLGNSSFTSPSGSPAVACCDASSAAHDSAGYVGLRATANQANLLSHYKGWSTGAPCVGPGPHTSGCRGRADALGTVEGCVQGTVDVCSHGKVQAAYDAVRAATSAGRGQCFTNTTLVLLCRKQTADTWKGTTTPDRERCTSFTLGCSDITHYDHWGCKDSGSNRNLPRCDSATEAVRGQRVTTRADVRCPGTASPGVKLGTALGGSWPTGIIPFDGLRYQTTKAGVSAACSLDTVLDDQQQTFCFVQCDTVAGYREQVGVYLYNDERGIVLWDHLDANFQEVLGQGRGPQGTNVFHREPGQIGRTYSPAPKSSVHYPEAAMGACTVRDNDNDGIADVTEQGGDAANPVDTDGDGTPDWSDTDSDNDGIPDKTEAGADLLNPADTDGDGTPDYRQPSTDHDGDGIPDSVEIGNPANPVDTDGDGTPDYLDLDSDGDGILDAVEVGPTPSSPVDSDGDGRPDYRDTDSDGDGIADATEGTA
eukprot:COSAG01_NODE_89_length_27311_cov_22.687061_11_plen_1317_part_00